MDPLKALKTTLAKAFSALLGTVNGRTRTSSSVRALFEHLRKPLLETYDGIYTLLAQLEKPTSDQLDVEKKPDLDVFLSEILNLCHGRAGFQRAANMLNFLQVFFGDLVSRLQTAVEASKASPETLPKTLDDLVALSRALANECVPRPTSPVALTCTLFDPVCEDDSIAIVIPDVPSTALGSLLDTLLHFTQYYFFYSSFTSDADSSIVIPEMFTRKMFGNLWKKLKAHLANVHERLPEDMGFVAIYANNVTSSIAMHVYTKGEALPDTTLLRLSFN